MGRELSRSGAPGGGRGRRMGFGAGQQAVERRQRLVADVRRQVVQAGGFSRHHAEGLQELRQADGLILALDVEPFAVKTFAGDPLSFGRFRLDLEGRRRRRTFEQT